MAEPPPTSGSEPPPVLPNPLPPFAGILNVLIAFLWFANAFSGFVASTGPVCLAPAAFALLAAMFCLRRTNWWAALLLTILAANALSAVLLVLSKDAFARPAVSGRAP